MSLYNAFNTIFYDKYKLISLRSFSMMTGIKAKQRQTLFLGVLNTKNLNKDDDESGMK